MPVQEMAVSPVKSLHWEQFPPMSQCRVYCTPVYQEGLLYVLGGCSETGMPLDTVEVLDVESRTWNQLPPLPTARAGASAVALGSQVMVLGGMNQQQTPLASVEMYHPDEGKWETKASLGQPSMGVTAVEKGSQSTGQGSSSGNAAASYGSYQGGVPSFAAAPYSAVGGDYGYTSGPTFLQGSGSQPAVAVPGVSGSGLPLGVGVQAAGVAQLGQATTALSSLPAVTYYSPTVYEPAGGYNAGAQAGQQETQWTVPTTVFSEAGSADLALGDILPPAAPAAGGAILTSGETASIMKEAEQGNYQQQTEEFGYPAGLSGSGQVLGQGLATVLVPGAQLGGFRPVSGAGKVDYMLAYGLYPVGSHVSFSQNHEAGKDYSQSIHYLKEHVTGGHGSGQQKKFFQGAQ